MLQLARHVAQLALHQVGTLLVQLHLLLRLSKLCVKLAVVLIEQFRSPLQFGHLGRISIGAERRSSRRSHSWGSCSWGTRRGYSRRRTTTGPCAEKARWRRNQVRLAAIASDRNRKKTEDANDKPSPPVGAMHRGETTTSLVEISFGFAYRVHRAFDITVRPVLGQEQPVHARHAASQYSQHNGMSTIQRQYNGIAAPNQRAEIRIPFDSKQSCLIAKNPCLIANEPD